MIVLISLLCILLSLLLFAGSFYMAQYVVQKQHRVAVLEDAYNEAVEEIKSQAQIIQDKEREIEQMLHQSTLDSRPAERQRAWNPSNPLNSEPRQ